MPDVLTEAVILLLRSERERLAAGGQSVAEVDALLDRLGVEP